MKLTRMITLLLMAAMSQASSNLFALESPFPRQAFPGSTLAVNCHHLMTEEECGAFLHTLSKLPEGEGRERFMTEHKHLMREREAACQCNRLDAELIMPHPGETQMARHF